MNSELLELQKDRDYFIQKSEITRDPGDKFIAECMVRKARNEVQKAKSRHCLDQINKYKQNPKRLWHELRQINPEEKSSINNLSNEDTGKRIQDNLLAEEINNYFIDVGENLARRFDKPEDGQSTYMAISNDQTYDLTEITQEQILRKVNAASAYKSSGIKDISSALMKISITALIVEFTHLYNLVVSTGIFPESWKLATVSPIPKVNNPKYCSELRPISILPLPGKIIEQIIHDQIKTFLESSKYIATQQNGFRKDRSTTRALAGLMDELLSNMDKGELTIAVYLDFKKAFDTIDHGLLLQKIQKAGLGKKTCSFIANYLTNRKQYTKLNDNESTIRTVKTGVPQGSTLGPLLFLIFVNDLPQVSEDAIFTLFADDAALTVHNKDFQRAVDQVGMVLTRVNLWCSENKLSLNTKKTEFVIYGTKSRKARAQPITLHIGGNQIREAGAYRYLGTVIDSTLNGNQQQARLIQSLALKMCTIRKMRGFISENTALLLYKSTVLPIIDYNDIIYGILTKQQLTKLQRIQNRALRTIYWGKTLSVKEMHDKANLDYLVDRRDSHLLSLMYRRARETQYIDDTKRNTRRADSTLLKVSKPSTNKLIKAPNYKGSIMWNNLPAKLRAASSYLEFKNSLRVHRSGQALMRSQ